MELVGERWRTLVSTVRLGRDEYRVVRPARPITHAPMWFSWVGVELVVDKAAAPERNHRGTAIRCATTWQRTWCSSSG